MNLVSMILSSVDLFQRISFFGNSVQKQELCKLCVEILNDAMSIVQKYSLQSSELKIKVELCIENLLLVDENFESYKYLLNKSLENLKSSL